MVDFQNDIEQSLEVLRSGGIILYPTDTVWGIGCDATNPNAVAKIYQLKKRKDEKAMILLVADEKDILHYTAAADLKVFDYLQQVNKPTTVIYEDALGLAANLIANDGSVAIRICKEDFCRQLIKRFRKPIVSTSANISGEPFPENFSSISHAIRDGVDYTVQYRQSDTTVTEPSAIIKWNKNSAPIIIRK